MLSKSARGIVGKVTVFCVSLLPAINLAMGIVNNTLGANPVESLTHQTGEWGLRFLLITLLITPLRRWFGWNYWMRFRRMLGLYSFFYVLLHFLTYLVFDHFFNIAAIIDDIIKRPYITVGFVGFLLLIPLAITSLSVLRRRLGKSWITLHRLVYVCALAGVVHFWWLVKADVLEPFIYALTLAVLLFARMYFWYQKRR